MFARRAALGLAFLSSACGGTSPRGLTPHEYSEGPLAFEPCPADLFPAFLGTAPGAECSVNRVPLRWDAAPTSTLIDVLVRRFVPPSAPAAGQIWMLDGGPGSTGGAFGQKPFLDATVARGWELYAPVHRGAGASTPLSCPDQEAAASELGAFVSAGEAGACGAALLAQWGPDLAGFTPYEAARDVAHLIARTRRPGVPVFVWGGSYGSYWAQRLLEVAPDLVQGVILEGLVPLDANFESLSTHPDEAARELLRQCADEPRCAQHFGPEGPTGAAAAWVGDVGAGAGCAAAVGITGDESRLAFAHLLINEPGERPLIAPLLARLRRCSASDQAELRHALGVLRPKLAPPGPVPSLRDTPLDPRLRNLRLGQNVFQLELFRPSLDRAALEARELTLFASNALSLAFAAEHDVWPRLEAKPPPAAASSVPMLLFAGKLDGQSPYSWSRRVAAAYAGPNQTLVTFEQAGHMTFSYAWTPEGRNCTFDLMGAFLEAPTRPLDLACVAAVKRLDVAGEAPATADRSAALFGTRAVWGAP
jgi:pimeloyl-ACP methyl ester carboxylesterase